MESIFNLGIFLRVKDMVSGPVRQIRNNINGLRGQLNSLGPAFDKFKQYGKMAAIVGAVMLGVLSGTVMATAATQKALGELSSVGVTNLAALGSAGEEFSDRWAGTTKAQFIAAAYDIKSGIASLSDTGVAEFTKLAALTGKATKATTAEMTSLFATGYGIYKQSYSKLSDLQFGQMFSAGIAGSVKQFKTTGSGMAQAISQLGATATTAKVPLQEQLTILGMLQATMSGSEAGTKYKAFMQSAAKAGKTLGLNFLDANKQLLSMPKILTKLKSKYGNTLDAMEKLDIQKAFGRQEGVAVIDLLYNKVGKLKGNIKSLSAAMNQGTGFTEKMAAAMNRDIGSGIALLLQRLHNLMEVIGKQLIPVLIPLFTWIGNLIVRVTQFAEKHKTLTKVVVAGTAVLSALLFTLGSLAMALGVIGIMAPNVITGFGDIKKASVFMKTNIIEAVIATKAWIASQYQSLAASIAAAGGIRAYAMSLGTSFLSSMGAAITAVWSFTAALLANPITWVVIGIAALGAALYLLYKKIAMVRTVIDGFLYTLGYMLGVCVRVGKGFVAALLHPITFIEALFYGAGQVISWLIGKFSSISPALKKVAKVILSFVFPPLAIAFNWGAVKHGVSAMLNWIKALFPKFLEAGKGLWNALISGIKSLIMKPAELVKKGLSFIRNLLPFSDAKEGPLSQLTLSGKRMMETISSGVKASAPVLKNAVAGALAGVVVASPAIAASVPGVAGKMINPAQTAIIQSAPEKPATPVIPGLSAKARWQVLKKTEVPSIPDLAAKAAWQTKQVIPPVIPDLSAQASWQAAQLKTPIIPDLSAQAAWQAAQPKTPVLPDLSAKAVWSAEKPATPVIPDLAKKIQISKQSVNPGANKQKLNPEAKGTGRKYITINLHNITLPNVSDGQSFVEQLKRLTEAYDA